MKRETDGDRGVETPTIVENGVIAILNDLCLRLQRIEVALAAASGVKESARRREIEQRRGYTTAEIARIMLRCSSDSIRTMIRSGKLGAINMRRTKSGKPKFIVMPEHLAAFVEANKVYVPPKPQRRRRPKDMIDFYPDTWEEYDYQVDSHPESAQWVSRPDGRKSGPRDPVRRDGSS